MNKKLITPAKLKEEVENAIIQKANDVAENVIFVLERAINSKGYEFYLKDEIQVDGLEEFKVEGVPEELLPEVKKRVEEIVAEYLKQYWWRLEEKEGKAYLKEYNA